MSVVAIPILNKSYAMGCADGQEMRLIELGKLVDARAKDIQSKIGALPESSLLATLCIVLADEIQSKRASDDNNDLKEILERIREINEQIAKSK